MKLIDSVTFHPESRARKMNHVITDHDLEETVRHLLNMLLLMGAPIKKYAVRVRKWHDCG